VREKKKKKHDKKKRNFQDFYEMVGPYFLSSLPFVMQVRAFALLEFISVNFLLQILDQKSV
jgi:hypothetical protein